MSTSFRRFNAVMKTSITDKAEKHFRCASNLLAIGPRDCRLTGRKSITIIILQKHYWKSYNKKSSVPHQPLSFTVKTNSHHKHPTSHYKKKRQKSLSFRIISLLKHYKYFCNKLNWYKVFSLYRVDYCTLYTWLTVKIKRPSFLD